VKSLFFVSVNKKEFFDVEAIWSVSRSYLPYGVIVTHADL